MILLWILLDYLLGDAAAAAAAAAAAEGVTVAALTRPRRHVDLRSCEIAHDTGLIRSLFTIARSAQLGCHMIRPKRDRMPIYFYRPLRGL